MEPLCSWALAFDIVLHRLHVSMHTHDLYDIYNGLGLDHSDYDNTTQFPLQLGNNDFWRTADLPLSSVTLSDSTIGGRHGHKPGQLVTLTQGTV